MSGATTTTGSTAEQPRTLFRKVWDAHVVQAQSEQAPAVMYIDRHLVQEVSSPQAFEMLRERGLGVRRPDLTLATADHSTPTVADHLYGDFATSMSAPARQVRKLRENCAEFGIEIYDLAHERRGIVHVIGPELGITQPGITLVCGDSHTSTHGALGALALGIGTTEVAHVLATQCLLQRMPKTLAVNLRGALPEGVSAKDIVLAMIGKIGVDGGVEHVIEYRGSAVDALPIEARMTICNMSIEAGARAGMMAPDDTTFEYLHGRPLCPTGAAWEQAVARWQTLRSDPAASFDKEVTLDVTRLAPQVTYGTNPGMVGAIDAAIPEARDNAQRQALRYMGLTAGESVLGTPIDMAFVGSCTNARLSDLREVARVLDGRRVAQGIQLLIVPGSQAVKRQAEAAGLHEIFQRAGAQWRESGCSMCLSMNGDSGGLSPGQTVISTSNRNFEGRQGPGIRTLLASPLTVAASAVDGKVCDPRMLLS
ncbi:MAG: 3-isopropylmalate dehydratase large subunit [Gammaproteobacteria bacterium]